MIRIILLVTAFAVAGFVAAPRAADSAHMHGAMHGPERAGQVELGAQAAFDGNGILWAAHKSEGHIAVSRSNDRGRTWSRPMLVTPAPETTDSGADARP